MASSAWRLEMENMLAAFNLQTTNSLSVISLAFKRSGLSFTPEFKEHFMQASTTSISEAYDRFQVNSMFEEQLSPSLNLAANLLGSSNDGTILYESNVNYSYIIDQEESNDFTFAVEMDETNDSVELVENHSDSTDADDDELSTVKVVLDRLDETTIAGSTEGLSRAKPLKQKNPQKKRMMKMEETNDGRDIVVTTCGRSLSKQPASRTQKKCSVCGYVTFQTGNFKRHVRTHTGEKPYGCDRCRRSFTSAARLMNHAVTHIAEFPFHCRACFQGFSLKDEKVAHENQCQQRHYECHLCTKLVTFDKAELIKHMRKHSGVKPFRCGICKKRFVLKHSLIKHLNTSHSRIDS